MSRTAVVCALVVASCLAAGVAPAAGASATVQEAPEFSSVHYTITVHEDGSAEWTFRYRTPLENETQREHFRAFAADFENQTLPLYEDFQDRAQSLVSNGEDVVARPMNATNFTRNASIQGLNDNLGVVSMSFTWTNFTYTTDAGRLAMGDLFEGGLYIGENQRLIVETGPDVQFVSVTPNPDAMSGESLAESDSVTWFGPYEFTDERPHAVFATAPYTTTTQPTTSTTGATTNPPTTPPESGSGLDALWLFVAALLVTASTLGVLWWRRTDTETASTTTDTAEPAVTDEEMVSDEERVRRLLEDHGGRMRQVQIVDQTDWSKSKVSMLLSEMEEDGEISRMRIGRENVVSLPGHEPDVSRDDDE